MVVREKNCYYAIALTDFFVFLSCAEKKDKEQYNPALLIATPFLQHPDC